MPNLIFRDPNFTRCICTEQRKKGAKVKYGLDHDAGVLLIEDDGYSAQH